MPTLLPFRTGAGSIGIAIVQSVAAVDHPYNKPFRNRGRWTPAQTPSTLLNPQRGSFPARPFLSTWTRSRQAEVLLRSD